MKNIFSNISFFLMAIMVLFLSIGMCISKMKCADDNQLYFGTSVPSCSIDTEVLCVVAQETIYCCPETNDASCASETENIHFDFETLVTEYTFVFSVSFKNV